MPNNITFQKTITDNGTTSIAIEPGEFAVQAAGTWGSGTLSIQWNDGTSAAEFPNGSFTDNGGLIIGSAVSQIDLVLSGATSPSIIVTGTRL